MLDERGAGLKRVLDINKSSLKFNTKIVQYSIIIGAQITTHNGMDSLNCSSSYSEVSFHLTQL